jgi:hypothetical protein
MAAERTAHATRFAQGQARCPALFEETGGGYWTLTWRWSQASLVSRGQQSQALRRFSPQPEIN